MSLLKRELQGFRENGAVIDLYRERIAREGLLCRAVQWSEHVLVVERIDENYAYDGISVVRPSDITRVRSGDRELRSIRRLLVQSLAEPLDGVATLELSAALTALNRRFSAVSLYVERLDVGMTIVGGVVDIDDDFVVLDAWGTARTNETYRVLVALEEVTRIDADTCYIRTLQRVTQLEG